MLGQLRHIFVALFILISIFLLFKFGQISQLTETYLETLSSSQSEFRVIQRTNLTLQRSIHTLGAARIKSDTDKFELGKGLLEVASNYIDSAEGKVKDELRETAVKISSAIKELEKLELKTSEDFKLEKSVIIFDKVEKSILESGFALSDKEVTYWHNLSEYKENLRSNIVDAKESLRYVIFLFILFVLALVYLYFKISSAEKLLTINNLDLVKKSNELNKAMNELQNTQDHLVQSEKMASLGQLVAGVAHEINTPVGAGVTASTRMIELTKSIENEFDNKKMTKDSLKLFFEKVSKTNEIILRNLERTAELVKNFKLVAADQTNLDFRDFDLNEYIHSVIESLRPEFRKTQIEVEFSQSNEIKIKQTPGTIAQILTNLLMNAKKHAFKENSKGKVLIETRHQGREIQISVIDNGNGIPEEIQKSVFDPFFTTKRGNGGTGLGLNIVYNLVTKNLAGKIECISELDQGTEFRIKFPETNQD